MPEKGWTIQYCDFEKEKHSLQEALCTLGNGFFTSRASLEMLKNQHKNSASDDPLTKSWNYPGNYIAGTYNRLKSKVKDRYIENEDFVNWPNWTFLNFRINDEEWFDPEKTELVDYNTFLHLKEGVLERKIKFKDSSGRITQLETFKLVSMDHAHRAAIKWNLIPQNWSGTITIRSGIDGNIINNNVERYSKLNQHHTNVVQQHFPGKNKVLLGSESKQSKISVYMGCKTEVFNQNIPIQTEQQRVESQGFIAGDFHIEAKEKQEVRIEKSIAIYTSKCKAISDPETEVETQLDRMQGFEKLLKDHQHAWHRLWKYYDIEIQTENTLDQLLLRLHNFHLLQTVSRHSLDQDTGIPARGWHGEAYRGHIFWDELYILPFISLHDPQLGEALLMYRYRRRKEAKESAISAGFRGYMFPWQSGSNGREETQKVHLNPESGRWLPDESHLQYHINIAIPYNFWQHYQSTNNADFLSDFGAEIILGCALFWSELVTFSNEKNKYEIRGVMGPDEYHTRYPDAEKAGLDNNAYTNIMVCWVMKTAIRAMEVIGKEYVEDLKQKTGFDDTDIKRWKDISENMYIPLKGSLLLQFDGYDNLKELDWDYYHNKYGNSLRLDRILEAEGDSSNNYKASKQADVLMLFYLLTSSELKKIIEENGYTYNSDIIPTNIEYYRKRAAHGSTLSQVIHSWVYARSHRSESWTRFRKALNSDFSDVQGGTTHEGIHLGAMAGTLDLILRCYSGLKISEGSVILRPRLPEDVERVSFKIRYRNHWIKFTIHQSEVDVSVSDGCEDPFMIQIFGKQHLLKKNEFKKFKL